MIGVARDMAPSVTDKRDTSNIILEEKRVGTQRQILVLIFREL
jgi:hypothetical protein